MKKLPSINAEAIKSRSQVCAINGCWIWSGSVNGKYGTIGDGGRNRYAHCVSYEVFHGPIGRGLLVCHRCDVPLCVNPDHLFVGTYRVNAYDCIEKGRWTRGSNHGMSKLTERAVKSIRARNSAGESSTQIAADFGVSAPTIRKVVARTAWAHVP